MGIRSKSGKLFLDFRWKSQRCREFTGLEDSRENRRRAEAFYSVIQGEIALGTFDYRKHFPNGARLADFYPHDVIVQRGQVPLVGDYLDDWHKRRSPFLPDGKVARPADLHASLPLPLPLPMPLPLPALLPHQPWAGAGAGAGARAGAGANALVT